MNSDRTSERPPLDKATLALVARKIAELLGLHYPPERHADLARALQAAARGAGARDVAGFVAQLLQHPADSRVRDLLAAQLTVGETYFFRDPDVFHTLEHNLLPRLIQSRPAVRRLRCWSAGCCTGEELYSLAILLRRCLPDWPAWDLALLGTDINPFFLRKARQGTYADWSFRGAAGTFRNAYFQAAGEKRWTLRPDLRRGTMFSYLNLAEETYPALLTNTTAMDLILCRNVMIYFTADKYRAVMNRLYRALAGGGWLVMASADLLRSHDAPFERVALNGFTYLRKPERDGGVPISVPEAADIRRPAPAAPPAQPARKTKAPEPQPARRTAVPAAPPTPPADDAQAAQRRGDYEAVVALLARAPDRDAPALAMLARACANLGRLDEARDWGEKAVADNKTRPEVHYLLATILQELGESEAAFAALRRALYLDPDFTVAHFNMALVQQQRGRLAEARRHLAQAEKRLAASPPDDPVPESEGLTAGRLSEIIARMREGLES